MKVINEITKSVKTFLRDPVRNWLRDIISLPGLFVVLIGFLGVKNFFSIFKNIYYSIGIYVFLLFLATFISLNKYNKVELKRIITYTFESIGFHLVSFVEYFILYGLITFIPNTEIVIFSLYWWTVLLVSTGLYAVLTADKRWFK